jgi:hypothetical protein
MKAICLESTYLLEDSSVKATEKGKIYTVINAAKNPLPKITKEGKVKQYAQGWWYQFAETGDAWHHQERFRILESEPTLRKVSQDPHKGAPRIAVPDKPASVKKSKIK